MTKISIEDIKKKTEKTEKFVHWLAEIFRGKNLVKKLIIIDVIIFIVFNPAYFPKVFEYFNYKFPTAKYWIYFAIIVVLVFTAAIIAALRIKPKSLPSLDLIEHTSIKGLRPFGFEDSEIFLQLQRKKILQECLNVILDRDFRFGIICGESGCGKTSFLQAGIWPQINQHNSNKLSHKCVYVKITHMNPLESIQQAIAEQSQLSRDDIQNTGYPDIIEKTINTENKTLVLLLDQFEQFFVSNNRYEERKPFIEALSYWYKKKYLHPVKIMIGIRGDFMSHLIELQKVMRYNLGPQDVFRLQNLSPKQAVDIVRVLADSSHLSFDESFVKEIAEHDLCNPGDGLISPVDIQIMAWSISCYTSDEEPGFKKNIYQKIGGIDGLLERYLKRALDVMETEEKKKFIIKILLALTNLELNIRKGEQTIEQIKEGIGKSIHEYNLEDALNWLKSSKVRLVTSTAHKGISYYELAHERIIPSLRRISGKELSEVEQANQLFEQRVNEWLGNERAGRFRLAWRDYRIIKKHLSSINWSKRKNQKLALLLESRKSLLRRIIVSLMGIFFIIFALFSFITINNQENLKTDLISISPFISRLLLVPIEFEHKAHILDILNSMGEFKYIAQCVVYHKNRKIFSKWTRDNQVRLPIPAELKQGVLEQDGYISIFYEINYREEVYGTIFMRTDIPYYPLGIPFYYFIILISSILVVLFIYFILTKSRTFSRRFYVYTDQDLSLVISHRSLGRALREKK